MDNYEISDVTEPPHKKNQYTMVWNVLTILILVSILCVISVYLLIFINPSSSLNPFPPPTLYPSLAAPTATVTPRFTLVPTWTPTNSLTQLTPFPTQSEVPMITSTPVELQITTIPGITGTPGGFAFDLKPGSPAAINSTTFHPDTGCNWSGVAGEATSLNGEGVEGLLVQLGGSIPGSPTLNKLTVTGTAPAYGPGGFEFTLAEKPIASQGTVWIQLYDQQELPISDRVVFDTYDDCERNLTIIYFVQVR
jgi:hypothetical protein